MLWLSVTWPPGEAGARSEEAPRMQLAQVEGFLEVARRANLSRAAEALFGMDAGGRTRHRGAL